MTEYIKKIIFNFLPAALALMIIATGGGRASAFEKRPAPAYISIVKITPSSAAGQIQPDAVFKAEFSSALDASTVSEKFVCLTLNNKPVKTVLKYLKNSCTVVVKPAEKLRHDKIYSLIFKTGLRGADGERLKSALMYQYSTVVSPDCDSFKVVSQYPLAGAEIYDSRPLIFVQFDRQLHFAASENTEDLADYLSLYHKDELIPSKVRYNKILKRLELTPAMELKSGGLYSAALSRKARGTSNKGLSETYVWQFIAYKPVFYLVSSYPGIKGGRLDSYDRILLSFSEPLDSKIDYEEYITVCDAKGGIINGKFMVYNVKNLIFMPDFAFFPGNYQLKISSQLKSYNANRLNDAVTIDFSVATDDYNVGEKIRDN
ncbi:MAG: hypothetical protein BWY32_01033 [bacterium ADurb.Bin243]|nr:MAG: hypothetical protein BWY32_01033 [bacterium ADurb.Bin243]